MLFFMQTSIWHFLLSSKARWRHRTNIFVRQTLLRLNIDIWVNFEPAVATQSHFRTQNCWTLESPQGMFLQVYSTLENVLRVHHTLERPTTGPSGNPQWGPSRGLKPLQREKEEKREWGGLHLNSLGPCQLDCNATRFNEMCVCVTHVWTVGELNSKQCSRVGICIGGR